MVELPTKPKPTINQLKQPLLQKQTTAPPETDTYVNCHECGGYIHKDRLGLLRKGYLPNCPIIETSGRVFCDTDCFAAMWLRKRKEESWGILRSLEIIKKEVRPRYTRCMPILWSAHYSNKLDRKNYYNSQHKIIESL
jgi:hypothetical protein